MGTLASTGSVLRRGRLRPMMADVIGSVSSAGAMLSGLVSSRGAGQGGASLTPHAVALYAVVLAVVLLAVIGLARWLGSRARRGEPRRRVVTTLTQGALP
jgi:cytochrome c oxidase assembly factor CtaG